MDRIDTKQKNYAIEWYRYFFTVFICILHIKEYAGDPVPFGGAYLAVEFFLLLSGFLLMQSIDRHPAEGDAETATLKFMKSRFLRFYPQYILSWVLLAAYVVFIRHSVSIKEVVIGYWDEILMLQMLGAGRTFNAAMWYVSALFIVSGIVYYLAAKNKKFFTHIFAPCAALLIYSYFYQTRGMLAGVNWNNLLIVRDGFWRALAGICLGCVIYEVYVYVEKMTGGGHQFPLLRTLYEAGTVGLLSVMFYRAGCSPKDFPLTGMMGLLILSVMCGSTSEGSYLTRFLCRFRIDGRYAYAMYCNHWVVNYLIRDYYPGRPFYWMLVVYLGLVILLSVITTKFISFIQAFIKGSGSQRINGNA